MASSGMLTKVSMLLPPDGVLAHETSTLLLVLLC